MKKSILILSQLLVLSFIGYSQGNGVWTWIHGGSAVNSPSSMGTKGVPSPNNEPPALYEPAEATDTAGNFWMFGGEDMGYFLHNDLFKYDPVTNEWTWMSGTNTPNDLGSYGARGVPSASNRPPCRGVGAASWADLDGNFWLFGGNSGSYRNDLWKFDISTNMWTWMKGPSTPNGAGTYGIKGTPDTANVPPSRDEIAAAWTDNNGDLWMFGGHQGFLLNDLWRYNIATNTWTWMKGSNTTNPPAVYGTKGVEAPANTPGSRMIHTRWKGHDGNLWLFGGGTWNNKIADNDLWRYNITTNNWTWMSGSNSINQPNNYGRQCIDSATNVPSGRFEARTAWTDDGGAFWLFGGGAGDGSLTSVWNDMWKYCPITNDWVWQSGDTAANPTGNWGTKGVASPTNKPTGRGGAVGWRDKKNDLYVFGGSNHLWPKFYNDLWKYTIDNTCGFCSIITPLFQASDTFICQNDCISFNNSSLNGASYQWEFTGGFPATSTDVNPAFVCYASPGQYKVKLTAYNSGRNDSLVINNYINVTPTPKTPSLVQIGSSIYCYTDSDYVSYQWYDSLGTPIPGATDTSLAVTFNGNFNMKVTNKYGCIISVGIIVELPLGLNDALSAAGITIYPNPATDKLYISLPKREGLKEEEGELKIYNLLGATCAKSVISGRTSEIDVSPLLRGIYFVHIETPGGTYKWRFVKE